MASNLHHSLCEVKGEVKLQATSTISRMVKQQPGKLSLSQMGDSFYIQCVYDNGIKPSKKYKLDRKQVAEAKLVARDGKLTVYLTDGCIRFHLEKGIENEIETFISCLDGIKRTVLTKAAVKYEISNISPIPRVDTLFGSKEVTIKTPILVLRRPAKGASRTPQKTNATKEQSKLMSQTPNKAPQQVLTAQHGNRQQTPDRTPREKLSQNQAKALQNSLTAQHGNRQQTPDRTPREKLSQNQAKALQKLTVTAQHRNRQQTPDGTPRENLSQNQAKALQKLTAQQGNRQPTPNKTPRENLSQNQAKPVQKLAAQQGDREQTPDKTSLRNTSFHEGKNQCRKSLGETSQQTLNKTPTSIPKLCSHPRNQQKQRMNVQKEDELEKENINIFFGSPEKQRPSENQSDSQSSAFGTPRKKTPLQENETSPQLSRSTNVKVFYGNSNNSIRVKRVPKRPLRNSSSSSPSQTPRYSLLSTTPTATRNIQTQNKPSSGDHHNVKQSTLFAYLSDNEVTSQGFTNLGNTCYMNAILQSILGLVPFVQELDNKDLLNTVDRLSLYNCMYNLFRLKNDDASSTRKKNALKRLKNSLNGSEMTKRFSGYLQNDAHEFMNICLDQMKEEVQEALGEKSEDIAAKVCPVVRNFEGSLRKYIKCKGCKDVVTKDELFNHLSLNIPHNQSRSPTKVQLTRLLGRFFQAEELERSCEKCKCATAVHYLKIRTLPRVIILHLLRSEFDQYRGTQEKNSHSIQVDRFLEIGSFCSSDISGPPPFVPKKTSPEKSHFVADNETPFSDEDFVVTKPRRRLNMSAALNESSDESPEKGTSTSKKSKKLPDWVYNQTKRPTLSYYGDANDDDDLKKAKLASLCETQLELSEEEQIKLATIASLQEKQADCEKEQIESTNTTNTQEKLTHTDSEDITHPCKEIASHQENKTPVGKGQIERERIGNLEGNQAGSSEERIKCTKSTSLQGEPTQFRKSEQIEHTKIKSLQGNQTDFNDEEQVKPTTIASHREKQRRDSENGLVEHAKTGGLSEEHIKHQGRTRVHGKQTDVSYERQIKPPDIGEQAEFPSDEEQIKLVNAASLQGERSHDSDNERLEQAMMASLHTEQNEDLKSDILSCEDVSEAELMEIDRIEEGALSSDSEGLLPVGNNIDSNTKNTTGCIPLQNPHHTESADNRNKSSQDSTNGSRKRSSLDSDDSVVHNTQSATKRDFKLNGGATELDTPSKRRKVEKIQVSSDGDEDVQLKKALEISKKEHDKSRSEQEAIERSQMEEAIRMSIEDGLINATVKNIVVEEPTEENSDVEKMETEETPPDEFSYRLVSVVSHVGANASAGHYISDVYDVETDQWTRYDDITAKKIKEYVARYDKISDGYIYFYMHKSCISKLLNQKSNQIHTVEQ